jgi:hypothetical protein
LEGRRRSSIRSHSGSYANDYADDNANADAYADDNTYADEETTRRQTYAGDDRDGGSYPNQRKKPFGS